MPKISKINLRQLFAKGAKPTQEAFYNWLDSFWHKDEQIEVDAIKGLQTSLDNKLDASAQETILNAFNDLKSELTETIKTGYQEYLRMNDTMPDGGWPPGLYKLIEIGNYSNLTPAKDSTGNIITIVSVDQKINEALWNGSFWSKYETSLPTTPVKQIFNPEDNINSSAMSAIADRYDNSNTVLKSFIAKKSTLDISSGFNIGYLKRDNTIMVSQENKYRKNIEVKGFNKLLFTCYPSVIIAALQSQYCSILGIKSDESFVVLRPSNLIPSNPPQPQDFVNEVYDVSAYTHISISIGNMGISFDQKATIQLVDDVNPNPESLYGADAVLNYINDSVNKGKNGVLLNSIKRFSSDNVTLGNSPNSAFENDSVRIVGNGAYALIKETTLNENSEMSIVYKENAPSNLAFGFRSNNNRHHVLCRYNTSGVNYGKLEILAKSTLVSIKLSDSVNTNYTIGDYLKIIVKRVGLKYFFQVLNLTKGWIIKMEQKTTPIGVPFVAHNTSTPLINALSAGSNVSVFEYKHYCNSNDIEYAIEGDSITFGEAATAEEKRWASQVLGNNLIMGGGADTTAAILSLMPEIKKVNPRKVLIMIGGNDILFGVSSEIWKENLRKIRNEHVNAGIEVIHLFPSPRAGASQLIDFLKTEPLFRFDMKIDTNTPLMNGDPDKLAVQYDSGDALHPNEAGHAKIAEIVNAVISY